PSAGGSNPAGPFPPDLVGLPNVFAGGINVQLENSVWGGGVNYRRNLYGGDPCAPRRPIDGPGGHRDPDLQESLQITEVGQILDPTVQGARAPLAMATDRFRTVNNFHGGQIGLIGEFRRGRWSVDSRASIAFGTVSQTAEIAGGQVQAFPGQPP